MRYAWYAWMHKSSNIFCQRVSVMACEPQYLSTASLPLNSPSARESRGQCEQLALAPSDGEGYQEGERPPRELIDPRKPDFREAVANRLSVVQSSDQSGCADGSDCSTSYARQTTGSAWTLNSQTLQYAITSSTQILWEFILNRQALHGHCLLGQ